MPTPTPTQSRFRPDIEGLRALAIGLVLLYHAGMPIIRGGFVGVDIFFVISGFLITGLLIRELESTGRISLLSFWGRRAKRLLPASLLVLIATAIATWLIIPNTSWRSIGADISAAAAYVVNWRFAAEAVDYNAEGAGVSPVKHFWSLAVEEQYYVIWPVLLVLLAAIVLRRISRDRYRFWIGVALACIVVPSFAWSLYYTGVNPSGAFFVTTTRLWELGVGAGVAVGSALWPRLPRAFAILLGWAGLAAVVASVLMFDGPTNWPGAWALLPVLGTAAMIIASSGRDRSIAGVGNLLSFGPFVWIGGLSYSWYLWHWPFLVLAEAQFGELRLRWALLAVLASGVVAWLSLKFVENPVRRLPSLAKSNLLAASTGINLSLIGVLTGLALILAIPSTSGGAAVDTSKVGAHTLSQNAEENAGLADVDSVASFSPAPADATSDMPPFDEACKVNDESAEVIACEYGNPNAAITIAAVGDSKIQQMESALVGAAENNDWRLVTYFKSGCAFSEPDFDLSDTESQNCAGWNESALQEIIALHPDAVLTTGRLVRDGRTEAGDETRGAEMIANWWNQLEDQGIPVIPVLDNPAPPNEVYECVATNLDQLSACSFNREEAIDRSGASYQQLAMELTGITEYIDLSDLVCPVAERCPAMIGDVLVYRQGSHLTNTYVETLTDAFGQRIADALTRLSE